jgi:curved DNA-binding protein CbpA
MRLLVAANSAGYNASRRTRSFTASRQGRGLGIGRIFACYLTLVVALLLVHHQGGSVVAASSSTSKDNNNNSTPPYEWEDLNYYQILGLEENQSQSSPSSQDSGTSAASITSKDIRKAYRRQAQQWHPDKLVGKKQQGQGTDQDITVEESNARFAKIAEAYSVLSNDDTRNDYNRYLRQQQRDQWQEQEHREQRQQQDRSRQQHHQQQPQQQSQQQEETASSWTSSWKWNDFKEDPLRMFEDFFFGAAEDGEDDNDFDDWLKNHHHHQQQAYGGNPYGGSGTGGGGSSPYARASSPYQQNHPNQRPIRTYEEEQFLVDAVSGRDILRILQTNEYEQGYYTVVAQDFVEEYDPYQRAFFLYPLQREPFVVDEGYRDAPQPESNQNNNNKQQQQPRGTLSSTLLPGSVLVPDHDRPLLQNGRFTVGISSLCELWIADGRTDTFVWTSETDLPVGFNPYQHQSIACQLSMRGPHLVLQTVGFPEQMLWYSDSDHVDDDYYYNDDAHKSTEDDSYFARLDADGSLAVYQKRTVKRVPRWLLQILSSTQSSRDKEKEKPIPTGTGRWAAPKRIGKTLLRKSIRNGKTLLRLAFDRVPSLSLVEEPVVPPRQSSSSSSTSSSSSLPTVQRLVCVSATGPVGCLGILRPVVKWIRDVKLVVEWAVSKLDHFLER